MNNWIVYGQTAIPSQVAVDNPTPNTAGVLGEVSSLPYTIPAGKMLALTSYGVESYEHPGTVVLFPWLGSPPATNEKALMSVGADGGSNEIRGANWHLPAGTIVNVRLIVGEATQSAWVYAWYMFGRLYTS